MRQEPRHQDDVPTLVIEQHHPTDNPALTLLDHPHTGLLAGLTRSGSRPHSRDVGHAACRDNREFGQGGEDVEHQPPAG